MQLVVTFEKIKHVALNWTQVLKSVTIVPR